MLANKNKKRKTNREIFFPAILGLTVLSLLAFFVISNWRINQRRSDLNSRIEDLKSQIQVLQEKNAEFKNSIVQVSSQEYLEKVAREELNYKKPGEEVVVVKPQATTTENSAQQEKSFWQKIREKLGF